MRLEQHIYTSGKPEFMTVAMTKGLSRAERLDLETRSLYILPTALMYQDHVETPVKFVYYPFGENRVVLGKAIYTGKDNLGRPGNYLFHNFIASRDDLFKLFHLNSITLLRYLETHGMFCDTVPETALTELELSPEIDETSAAPSLSFQDDLLTRILYVCLSHDSFQLPLLLKGSALECLGFLDQLYPLLPYHLRLELSFDTYTYGVNLGFQIQGLPEQSEFRQNLSPALALNPSDLQYNSSFEMPVPSKRLTLMSSMISTGKLDDLNTIYLLEYYLEQDDYARFLAKYRDVSQEIVLVILDFHRPALLDHITEQHDIPLLRLIQEHLVVEDLHILASRPDMIHLLLESGETKYIQIFVEWLCIGDGEKSECYPVLFEFFRVWDSFLERIVSQPQNIEVLLESLRIFPRYYAPEYEDRLFRYLFTALSSLVQDKRLSREFLNVLETFPSPDASELLLLRTAVIYALNHDSDLLDNLLNRNLARLPEGRQEDVLDVLLRGVFQTKKPEEMQQQLHKLLEKSLQNEGSLLVLLRTIEQIEFSKKVRTVLEDLLAQIPQSNRSPEVDTCIQTILKPPPSFFERLREKILENL